jgi:hypothetical protein
MRKLFLEIKERLPDKELHNWLEEKHKRVEIKQRNNRNGSATKKSEVTASHLFWDRQQ